MNRRACTVAAVVACLFLSLSASAATCPTAAPSGYQPITYAGTNCNSSLGGQCAIGQPVGLTLSIPSYYQPPFESCDVVTWQFGDGTSQTTAAGVSNTTHTYASAGNYTASTTITNSLGTQASYYPTTISVGNGSIYLPDYGTSVNEGSSASIIVRRTTGTGTASVNYATSDLTAVAGQQYAATSGTLTFADGEVQKTISVPTLDDHVYRTSTMQFRLTISAPTAGYLLSSYYTVNTITIVDTDPRPMLAFAATSYTVSEASGSLLVRVIRSGELSSTVSVGYIAGYYYDSSSQTGILTFFPNETVKTFTVQIVNDDVYTGNRSTTLSLRYPTNGAVFPNGSTYDYYVPLTITDDEPVPVVTISDTSVAEGGPGAITDATMTVSLSTKLSTSLTLQPQVTGGTARYPRDYITNFPNITIPAGSQTATFTVRIVGNSAVEADKTLLLSAYSYFCCSVPPLTIVPGKLTIVNDDASVTPGRISIARGGTGSIFANFGSKPAVPQTVTLTSSDPAIASVPSSVNVGAATEQIAVTADKAGQATITATIPAAYGGGTFTTDVYVYDGAVMVLSPSTVSVPVGGTATISASLSPALGVAEGAALKAIGNGAITLPDRVIVEAGGTSTFTITGLRKGLIELTATLGPDHGGAVTAITVEVNDPPTTPSITQVSPANGPAAGGTSVTINGANLRNDCTIRFGGVPASNVAFVSASSMTATTPEHAAGATDVTLSCGGDMFNFSNGFTFLAASATLANLAPGFGTTAGNTLVKITGTNIASGCWPFFDGIAARAAIVSNPAEMIASTPAHSVAATVPLLLRCPAAADVSLANAFTYSSAAESSPVITAVDPLVGSAGKSVTISGARFRFDDAVTFDAVTAAVLSTSPGTHVVRIPDMPLGRVSITVTELTGHSSTTGPIFTIVEPQPPQIAGVSPATTRPGNEITLDGSGFRPGYSFTIGDLPATLLSMTYTRVVLRVPQLSPSSYGVNVLNSASKIAAVGPQLKVLAAGLAVTRVAPICATTEGGLLMTINGSGFTAGAVVTFNGAVAAGVVVTDAQTITLTLPPLPAGSPRIVVTNPNGDSASLSNAFNVTSPFDPSGCAPRPRPARH